MKLNAAKPERQFVPCSQKVNLIHTMISIVVPVYNEAENVGRLYQRVVAASGDWGQPFELIFVNDGSTDSTLGQLLPLAHQDARVKVVQLSRNFGHQAAMSAGLAKARGKAIVLMDGDLQDPPEVVVSMLEKWHEGFDVVYAIREKRKENLWKKSAYYLFYRILQAISDIKIPLDSGDFCLMDRRVQQVLLVDMPEQLRFVRGLRAYAGFRQTGLPYERAERAAGKEKYTFSKLIKLALDGIFGFSTFPLKLSTYLGFLIAVPSFLVGIFFIFHRLIGFKVLGYSPQDTPGLATLAVGMFFLGGIMLMMLGILGEYLGRIYIEVKKRPFYIIDEVIDQENLANTSAGRFYQVHQPDLFQEKQQKSVQGREGN
jgi:dolichol-phosphate mannosyltransferase